MFPSSSYESAEGKGILTLNFRATVTVYPLGISLWNLYFTERKENKSSNVPEGTES